jgi:hypothetical protein
VTLTQTALGAKRTRKNTVFERLRSAGYIVYNAVQTAVYCLLEDIASIVRKTY